MRQIYNFDQHIPPILNESMLRAEMERRKLHLQTALVALAAILLLAAMTLLGFLAYEAYPWITLFCFLYALVSVTGGSALAVVFTRKGGQLIWRTQL